MLYETDNTIWLIGRNDSQVEQVDLLTFLFLRTRYLVLPIVVHNFLFLYNLTGLTLIFLLAWVYLSHFLLQVLPYFLLDQLHVFLFPFANQQLTRFFDLLPIKLLVLFHAAKLKIFFYFFDECQHIFSIVLVGPDYRYLLANIVNVDRFLLQLSPIFLFVALNLLRLFLQPQPMKFFGELFVVSV